MNHSYTNLRAFNTVENSTTDRQRYKWEDHSDTDTTENLDRQRINLIPQIPKKVEKTKDSNRKCSLKNCAFCANGTIPYLQNIYKPGWRESAIAAFKGILSSDSTKGWLSLTDDIYPLFESHWDILCPSRKERDDAWRKHLQDALSHNKKYFISGKEVFGQTGYWRLRLPENDNSPALPDPHMGLPLRKGSAKRGSDEFQEDTIGPPVKRERVTDMDQQSAIVTISVLQQNFISTKKQATVVKEEKELSVEALSNAMNSYEVIGDASSEFQTGLSLSKEFGWHFSNFLSRAKIINLQSIPPSPPLAYPNAPAASVSQNLSPPLSPTYGQPSNFINYENANRRYAAGKTM